MGAVENEVNYECTDLGFVIVISGSSAWGLTTDVRAVFSSSTY